MTENVNAIAVPVQFSGSIMSNPALFDHTWRVAQAFARSTLVPKHLQGKTENCMVALDMARILNENPLVVLQNIFFVNDTAGWRTQYLIGKVNRSGLITGRINWRITGKGEDLTVTAFAALADTSEEAAATVDMKMAKAEGWTKNPKYQSMPEHMLKWRSAAFLCRLYFPDVMFGLPTEEEVEDMKFAGKLQPGADGAYALEETGTTITAADIARQAAASAAEVPAGNGTVIDGTTGEVLEDRALPQAFAKVPRHPKTGEFDWAKALGQLTSAILTSATLDDIHEWQALNLAWIENGQAKAPEAYERLCAAITATTNRLSGE